MTIKSQVEGLYYLMFRYSLQSGSRPIALQVNGQVVNAAMSFPATGNWTTWQYVRLPAQELVAAANTIRVTAAVSGGPNIDHLLLALSPTSLGDYNSDGFV